MMAANGRVQDSGDLREIVGDIDEETAAEILALEPTPRELEVAMLWARGEGASRGEELTGKTSRIFDLLTAAEE